MVIHLIKHLLGLVITALGQKCVPSKGGDVLKANMCVLPIMGQYTIEKFERNSILRQWKNCSSGAGKSRHLTQKEISHNSDDLHSPLVESQDTGQ